MEQLRTYLPSELEQIREAYLKLLPSPINNPGPLENFFDLNRQRKWALLTSPFHAIERRCLENFHSAWNCLKPSFCAKPLEEIAEQLRTLALDHGCGFSLGISPWTDHALLRTIHPGTKNLIVVVGHDWYPIIPNKFDNPDMVEARSPMLCFPLMEQNPLFAKWQRYATALRLPWEQHWPSETGLLFLNLVPDFRPPGMSPEGRIPFRGFDVDRDYGYAEISYGSFAQGLKALLEEVSDRFPILGVVGWGAPVREALLSVFSDSAIQNEGRWTFCLRSQSVSFFPLLHPSARPKDFPEGEDVYYESAFLKLLHES